MEDFDFNAPIKTILFFDDSDDETKSSIDVLFSKSLETEASANKVQNINLLELNTSTTSETNERIVVKHDLKVDLKINQITRNTKTRNHEDTILNKGVKITAEERATTTERKSECKQNNNISLCPFNVKLSSPTKLYEKNPNTEIINTVEKIDTISQDNIKTTEKSKKSLDMPSLDMQELQEVQANLNEAESNNNKLHNNSQSETYVNTALGTVKITIGNMNSKETTSTVNSSLYIPPVASDKSEHRYGHIMDNKHVLDNCNTVDAPKTPTKSCNTVRKRKKSSDNKMDPPKKISNVKPSTAMNTNNVYTQEHKLDSIENNPNSNALQGCTVTETNIVSQADIDQTESHYISKLLDSVSEHMIYILNAYYTYMHIYNNMHKNDIINNARNTYKCTKQHFFDLSYSTVMNLIIPKENNSIFIKKFIDNTVTLANSKSYQYSYQHVHPLYLELIKWAKQRKQYMDKMQVMAIHQIRHPFLTQMLSKPPTPIQMNTNLSLPYPATTSQSFSSRPLQNGMPYIDQTNTNNQSVQGNSNYTTGNESLNACDCCVNQRPYTHNINNTTQRLNYNSIQSLQNQIDCLSSTSVNLNNITNLEKNMSSASSEKQTNNLSQNVTLTNQRYYWSDGLASSQNNQPYQHSLMSEQNQEQLQSDHLRAERIRLEQLGQQLQKEQFNQEKHKQGHVQKEQFHPGLLEQGQLGKEQFHPEKLQQGYVQKKQVHPSQLQQIQLRKELLPPVPLHPKQLTNNLSQNVTLTNQSYYWSDGLVSYQNNQPYQHSLMSEQNQEQLQSDHLRAERIRLEQLGQQLQKEQFNQEKHKQGHVQKDQFHPGLLEQGQLGKEQFHPEKLQQGYVQKEQVHPSQLQQLQLRKELLPPEPLHPKQIRQEELENNNYLSLPIGSIEPHRSSISRDSGIMSPLNFNGTNDQSSMQDEQSSGIMPLITHVTSLSSKASYITEGLCCICSKSTRKKCVECYSRYYCSQGCQYQDWVNHKATCRSYNN